MGQLFSNITGELIKEVVKQVSTTPNSPAVNPTFANGAKPINQPTHPISQRAQYVPTINPDEFHPETMVAGSTGDYQDMKGGAHFNEYDCGHSYNDKITGIHEPKQAEAVDKLREALKNPDDIKNAIIMSEVINRRSHRRNRR